MRATDRSSRSICRARAATCGWEIDRWYSLTWLQLGNRIRGAIDGTVVVDFTDDGFQNNGPVLRNGRIALRAMMRTDVTLRNLRVLERPDVSRTWLTV